MTEKTGPGVLGGESDEADTVVARATEAQWQKVVTDLAELNGWVWAHFRPAQTERGWRTPVSGPGGAGFPDLVLWRERVIFVELKSESGRLSSAQRAVVGTDEETGSLEDADAEVYVWRPSHFDYAREVLSRRRRRS